MYNIETKRRYTMRIRTSQRYSVFDIRTIPEDKGLFHGNSNDGMWLATGEFSWDFKMLFIFIHNLDPRIAKFETVQFHDRPLRPITYELYIPRSEYGRRKIVP